ncbi:MAG: hypothetical protein ABI416_06890 [Ginsengibacter sp.]
MPGDKILSGELPDKDHQGRIIGSDDAAVTSQPGAATVQASTLAERIALSTESGGPDQLQEDFDDEDGDWKIINSPDPFTILYLDYRQYNFITPEVVKKNYSLLEKFWKSKYEIMNTGGNRIAFKSKYGDGTIENSLVTIKRAFDKIGTSEGIQRYFTELNNARLKKGEEGLKDSIEHMMLDGSADKAEIQLCFERGLKYDLGIEESADIITKKLEALGFNPYGNVSGNKLSEKLLSVDSWMTEKKIVEAETTRRERESLRIQILPGKYASSIEDIGTILFNDPDEAKQIIKEDLLKQVIAQKDMVLAREISSISNNSKDLNAAFFQIVFKLNRSLPFPFIDQQKAKNIQELTSMIFENEQSLKAGKDDLKKGYIENWLKETDKATHAKLISIRDSSENFDQAFLATLYSFNPTLPYRFGGNILIKNIYELSVEINNNSNNWNAGKTELYNGSILTWLQYTGSFEIVKRWNAVKDNFTSQDVGLEEFLHILNEKTPYSKITTPLTVIAYPKIQSGKVNETTINFSLENRGYTEAVFSFSKDIPGITLTEKKLAFTAAAGQINRSVTLGIYSSVLRKGVEYNTELIVSTSAHQQIKIPVSFKIVFPKNAFIIEILKYAAIFSALFIFIRAILSSTHNGWLRADYNYFLTFDQAFYYNSEFSLFGGAFFLFISCLAVGIYFLIKYLNKNGTK